MQELVEKAKSLGAYVVNGDLDAAAQASKESKVIVVMAHGRNSEVAFEDLASGHSRQDWRRRALQRSSPLAQWVAVRLGQEALSIVDVFNESLKAELPDEPDGSKEIIVRESDITCKARRREVLDSIFIEMIRPGNRLELLDGLHSKEVFEAAIAADFAGVLDFTACTSTILADYVARRRKYHVRTVQAPCEIQFVAAAPIVGGTLELLASGLYSYQDAHTLALRELKQAAWAT
jgi:hypothetical protein